MRHWLRSYPRAWRAIRLIRRWYSARFGAYPEWRDVLDSGAVDLLQSRRRSVRRQKILLATSIGSYAHATTLESALAASLTLRGADVHVFLCDGVLPACAECEASLYPNLRAFVEHGPSRDLCRDCFWPSANTYTALGVKIHRYSEYLTVKDRERAAHLAASTPVSAISTLCVDGIPIGEHVFAGALRFFATGSLEGEPHSEPVLRRYLHAGLLTAFATRRLLQEQRFESVTLTHGIYIPWGIIGEVARQAGSRVITWNVAYRKRRLIFSHDDTYHHTLLSEPVQSWEHLELTVDNDRQLTDYLVSRREGLFDWIVFHRPSQQSPDEVVKRLSLDTAKPTIGLLTNVSWDAQLHYPANAFPNMLQWLVATCHYFAGRPDLQLVIRVHPAEISGFPVSRQPILRELSRRIPQLASNITVIPPESDISTYALMATCNAVIIYGTKMGVELTSIGIPVIVAGEAWIRGKGITFDATCPEDYRALLDCLPMSQRMSLEMIRRARRYAFHFFFRRMIPVSFIKPKAGFPVFVMHLRKLMELEPGAHKGLDVICDGILKGSPFVYDEPS